MLIPRIYYAIKPLLPSAVRLGLRRWRSIGISERFSNVWPIFPAGSQSPHGWEGWPEKRQFSFVLTHDVEGQAGLERCRQLAEIDIEFGFRSSFNFIPSGEYNVPTSLLEWLREKGFEIGVHDLQHKGKLFRSQRAFTDHAEEINKQLVQWGAVGFRAGFMLHQLDWLHALNIEYDGSTFDIDPFEPQPDGVETIFPFWVPTPGSIGKHSSRLNALHGGYVELPYTLVQDYNLFVVLGQRTTEIWDRKLEWIAAHGGMALMNTHPDYMAFDGRPPRRGEYPVELYRDFLKRVRQRYGDLLYSALPRDIARLVRERKFRQAHSPRNVAMVTFSNYEADNRVRRYAETLARGGDHVTVYSIASAAAKVGISELHGVRVNQLFHPDREDHSKFQYLLNYGRFWWKVFCHLGPGSFPGRCDLLHVHNMPEFLVFAAARLKWRGARIILDLHDLMPELYQDKFGLKPSNLLPRLLRWIERCSCQFSDHVIISNHLWKDTVATRSCRNLPLTAMINNVDLNLFCRHARNRHDDRFVIVYPGSLGRHQGIDLAIDAMVEVVRVVPKAELHVYGRGPELENLKTQASRLGLDDKVRFRPSVPLSEIAGIMANADLGIVPKRADGFGNEAFSTKIMEFMSQGLPVVLSRTKVDTYYFNDQCVSFFESGNSRQLAERIIDLAQHADKRAALSRAGLEYVRKNSWEQAKHTYLDIVDQLTRTRMPVPNSGTIPSVESLDGKSLPLANATGADAVPSSRMTV